jgi:hypothetical protein
VCGQDLSDHRPVCASLELEVPGQGPNPVGEDSAAAGVLVVRLWLGGARVELEDDPAKEGYPPSARPAPALLTVLYPIVSEDPLAFRRKAAALRLVRPSDPCSLSVGLPTGPARHSDPPPSPVASHRPC